MLPFDKIKSNGEFHRAYAKGKCLNDRALAIYVFKNKGRGRRLGITTGKKLGNAVTRNRARRIIREAFRKISPQLRNNRDYVIVARSGIINLKSTDIYNILLARLGNTEFMADEGKND